MPLEDTKTKGCRISIHDLPHISDIQSTQLALHPSAQTSKPRLWKEYTKPGAKPRPHNLATKLSKYPSILNSAIIYSSTRKLEMTHQHVFGAKSFAKFVFVEPGPSNKKWLQGRRMHGNLGNLHRFFVSSKTNLVVSLSLTLVQSHLHNLEPV